MAGRHCCYQMENGAQYINKAEVAVRNEISALDGLHILSELWTITNKIEVITSFPHKKYKCYKERRFNEDGWCYVGNFWGKYIAKIWGFCSSSCKLMNSKDTKPAIYHKMIWEFPGNRGCRVPSQYREGRKLEPWDLCVVSLLPQTSVFRLKRDGEGNLKLLFANKEKPEEIFDFERASKSSNIGHQLPCMGDSGAGHWMYDSKTKKRALIAITSYGYGQFCGNDEHAMKATYPSVLQWIKRHSGIRI